MIAEDKQAASDGVNRGALQILGFKNPELEFQLIRALGLTCYGGGSVGELLYIADQIRNQMSTSPARLITDIWVDEHKQFAQRLLQQAQLAKSKQSNQHARDLFSEPACTSELQNISVTHLRGFFKPIDFTGLREKPRRSGWG